MPVFPGRPQLRRALERARAALSLPSGAALSPGQASVFFKYLLLEGVEEVGQWRRRSSQGLQLRRHLEGLLQECREVLEQELGQAGASPIYRQRLVELALEGVVSEPLAPETCIEPLPVGDLELPGQWHHLVCFASAPLFTHEFYPLVVDAFARDSARYGRSHFNVLGAHLDWFDREGRVERLLYLDPGAGCFRECPLQVPIVPNSVHFLCLGRWEQELHAQFSARLDCPQLNPAGAAALADDKARTLEGWERLGIRVPAWQRLPPGDRSGARRFLEAHGEVVVKPNQATEGEGVEFFDCQAGPQLEEHLESLWEVGEVLIQERADGLLYQDPHRGARRTLALRLNAAFDGERHHLESGCAQLGADGRSPASRGRGGELRQVDEALSHLVRRQDGRAVDFSPAAWEEISQKATRAAQLFADLMLVGLDVVLDGDERGEVEPIFVEANPRPAGLSHARFLGGEERGLPGVSLKLWDGLERLESRLTRNSDG